MMDKHDRLTQKLIFKGRNENTSPWPQGDFKICKIVKFGCGMF